MTHVDTQETAALYKKKEDYNSIGTVGQFNRNGVTKFCQSPRNENDNNVATWSKLCRHEVTVTTEIRQRDVQAMGKESKQDFIERCNGAAKLIYTVLFIPRMFSLFIFVGYDMKCAMFEKTTFVNCTQKFLVAHPKTCVYLWKGLSIASSTTLVFILWCHSEKLNYSFRRSFKRLSGKAAFWSTVALFVATMTYYVVRMDGSDIALSVLLLIWWPATLLVVCVLNYLLPVEYPDRKSRDVQTMSLFLGFWVSLVAYCVESFCMVCVLTLAGVLKIAPLLNGHRGDTEMEAFVLISFALRVAFSSRLSSFFLNKIFHGDKDLFSGPSKALETCKQND